jgi:branched-chain amino acid aminotransferase group I
MSGASDGAAPGGGPRLPDPRNASIWVHVGGELLPREQAKVSVFDSVVQGGDAVWEGLRVYGGRIFALDRHLDRLLASAHALAFAGVPTRDAVKRAVIECLAKNGMRDGAHVRLTLTRGRKVTSGMDPRNNQYGPTLIVLPEWKGRADTRGVPVDDAKGQRLITAAIRRNPPQCVDSKIHHNNLINNILAKIEANVAGADDALMLDLQGFVSETNATNVFVVRKGVVLTPFADACLPGVTRAIVLELCERHAIPCREKNLSLTEAWTADEMFTTGTLGELAPVAELDGRRIGGGVRGPVTARLQGLYRTLTETEGEPLP